MEALRKALDRITQVERDEGLAGARFWTSHGREVGLREAASSIANILENDVQALRDMEEGRVAELTEISGKD